MKFEISMENILQIFIPLSIILVVIFLFWRNKTTERYDNFPPNIKSIIENAARKEVQNSTGGNDNNQQCGPNFAPANGNYRLNAGQQANTGPSCNYPGYQAPAPYQGQMPPHPGLPQGQMPPVQMPPQGYAPQQMPQAPVPAPAPAPAPAPSQESTNLPEEEALTVSDDNDNDDDE